MRLPAGTFLAALVCLAGCDAHPAGPAPGSDGAAAGELRVTDVAPAERKGLARDEPLVLRFSAPLDPSTLAPGTVRVIRREDGADVAVRPEIAGNRLILHAPEAFGFDADTVHAVVVEGFPSLLALRGAGGEPLAETWRISFTTGRAWRPDIVPPRVRALELDLESEGAWRIRADFTEPVDPDSLVVGRTFRVTDADSDTPVPGRLIPDRTGLSVRFLPASPGALRRVRVRLTGGVSDRTGNPLHVHEKAEATFRLPEGAPAESGGEIAEDFTTDEYLDPAGTTALWNGSRFPGALLAEPATTVLELPGDPDAPETFFRLGADECRIEMILTREELGVPREITGIVWAPAGSGFVPATYEWMEVEIVPTTREALDGPGFEIGAPETVLSRRPLKIDRNEWERLRVPFFRSYAFDGETNLRLTIRVGAGDHTNFVRCRPSDPGVARIVTPAGVEALQPVLSLRCFSWRPTATSRFYDTGLESPDYLPAVVHPGEMPDGVESRVSFQGAQRLGAGGRVPEDDPDAASDWVDDPADLSGYRFLRFRIRFFGVSLSGNAAIDDLVVPFRRSR